MSDTVASPEVETNDELSQPIHLRRRRDLIVSESEFQQEKCWIIKDPVTLKYFRLRELEFTILNMLNGQTTLGEIHEETTRMLGGTEVETNQIKNLISSLFTRELLVSRRKDHGEALLDRGKKMKKLKRMAIFTNLLSIRFPGIDPERFLTWLYPKTAWIFHPITVIASVLIVLAAGLLVMVNANELTRRLPDLQQFFGVGNLVLLSIVLIVTKSLHEIGHGLACKHFKGECHAIGIMLLVLMPVMYCNTSDSWVLKNKWHRMAIGAAGMYVEVVLASICTFVWWYTNPGWLHFIALNVMFIGSVTTVIFNANPLLRYDGYYILSDFLEIPNLGQKSRAALLSQLRSVCLGLPKLPRNYLPQRRQFAFVFYSVASFCYRWFILFVILWFLTKIFEPYGLQFFGHYMIAMSILMLVGMPIYKLVKFFSNAKVREQVNKPRMFISAVVLALVLLAVWFVPVPHHVNAPFVVRPNGAKSIYVKHPGILRVSNIKPGQHVDKDQIVGELEDLEAETRLLQLKGRNSALQREIDMLSQLESSDANRVQQLSSRIAELQANENQLVAEQRIVDSLKLKAPITGIVLPPQQMKQPNPDTAQLETWSGSPLEEYNERALLERDTEFCRIGVPGQFEAVLEIDQSNIDLVDSGNKVKLVLDEYQSMTLRSEITDVAISDTAYVASELAQESGGAMATRVDAMGRKSSMFTSYQAIVPIETGDLQLLSGFRGQARIRVGSRPLGQQLLRYLRSVFNFS